VMEDPPKGNMVVTFGVIVVVVVVVVCSNL
jgi:hypothetical protein